MEPKTYTTSELLKELKIPYYSLEYLIRTNQVTPISEGRSSGRERRFTDAEVQKAIFLTRHHTSRLTALEDIES